MFNRTQVLRRLASFPAVVGLASCTGDGPTDEDSGGTTPSSESVNETPTDRVTESPTDTPTETPTPTPEAEWKRNIPKCSSTDHTVKVRGVSINTGGRTVTVSFELLTSKRTNCIKSVLSSETQWAQNGLKNFRM